MSKTINLKLPDFAFLDDAQDGQLEERNVILHVRSASVVEILERGKAMLYDGVLSYKFTYTNTYGISEPMVAVLHYTATLDKDKDTELIRQEILKPSAQWYCKWAEWEDKNIEEE